MQPIRVLVVEDSITVRERLLEVLGSDPALAVVGVAGDGRRAIELCRDLRPDVITLDMMLPVMSGLAATEYIMAHMPTPILVVSSSTNRGELFKTYDALAAGAVDVLDKPRGDGSDADWERRFLAAVKLVSRIKVITHPRARLDALGLSGVPVIQPTLAPGRRPCELVAIGASTGGPGAITEILRAIPTRFGLPILLLLHIDEPFGSAFADWLDAQTAHRVSLARDGEPIASGGHAGRIRMAPPGHHLVVRGGHLGLIDTPPRHSCRPSVDVLFESVAREIGGGAAACLLTGMGRDGAAGLLAVRRAGGVTIAQDEATSVVYGMPREAVLLGAAESVLPLSSIGPAVTGLDPAQHAHPPPGRPHR